MKTNFCRFLIGLVAFVVGIPVMAQTGPDKVKPFSHLSVSLNAGTLGGGLQVAAPLNDYLGLRAGFSLLKFKCNYDYDGIRDDQLIQDAGTRTGYNPDKYYTVPLKAKANMTNGMLLLDYFPLSCPSITCLFLKKIRIAFDKSLVATIVNITVTHDNAASRGHKATIITTVPITVSIPENKELIDCDTVVEIFSISLVIRLIISP